MADLIENAPLYEQHCTAKVYSEPSEPSELFEQLAYEILSGIPLIQRARYLLATLGLCRRSSGG